MRWLSPVVAQRDVLFNIFSSWRYPRDGPTYFWDVWKVLSISNVKIWNDSISITKASWSRFLRSSKWICGLSSMSMHYSVDHTVMFVSLPKNTVGSPSCINLDFFFFLMWFLWYAVHALRLERGKKGSGFDPRYDPNFLLQAVRSLNLREVYCMYYWLERCYLPPCGFWQE